MRKMTAGEQIVDATPIGGVVHLKLAPDGVHGPVYEARVVNRVRRWGLARTMLAHEGGVMEVERAVNGFGRLRLRGRALWWFSRGALAVWMEQWRAR
jgi:hypothetical protein